MSKGERPPDIPEVRGANGRRLEVNNECPYRGLAAFRETDAPFFFGRAEFAERLHQALCGRSVVAVIVGSSGSGKSSAVYAGLLPRLRTENEASGGWLLADFRPGAQPFHALAAALLPLLESEMNETGRMIETRRLAEALSAGELPLLDVVKRLLAKNTPAKRLLLIADQFEELYTLCPQAETRRRFLDVLLDAAHSANGQPDAGCQTPLVFLLTMRADFMGQALAYRPFADALQEAAVILGPMNREELRTAIVEPAHLQGAAFEAGLVERLLDDVGDEPGSLPLLEFALTLLWERQSYGWMTHAGYESIGRVEGALARYAGQAYAALPPEQQSQARQVFLQLVQPGTGTEDTRRTASRDQVGTGNWELVQHLADRRLVVTGRDADGGETVEVVHEALIQGWDQLRAWIDEDRAFRTWQERLRANLRQWQESGEDEGALLRGAPLAEAEGWLETRRAQLSEAEIVYIQGGLALRQRRQQEKDRRRRNVIIALATGLLVALFLVGVAWQQRQDAIAQRQVAIEQSQVVEAQRQAALKQTSVGLANSALLELESGLQDRGLLLALESLEKYPYTPQAERALGQAVLQSRLRKVLPHDVKAIEPKNQNIKWQIEHRGVLPPEGAVMTVEWSPDGTRLLTTSADMSAVRIWDAAAGQELTRMEYDYPLFTGALWSPDGGQVLVLVNYNEQTVMELWDSQNGEKLFAIPVGDAIINSARWSPDRTLIAAAGRDEIVRIWDANSGDLFRELKPGADTDWLADVAWSPDGKRLLVTGTNTGEHFIYDVSSAEWLFNLQTQNSGIAVCGIWSPSGEYILLSGGADTTLWDAGTGELLHTYPISGKAASWLPSGEVFLANGGGSIQVFDLASPEPRLEYASESEVIEAIWSPSGDRIAAGFQDGSIVILDAASGRELLRLGGHRGAISSPLSYRGDNCFSHSLAWSPDGRWLASAGEDGAAAIWDTMPFPRLSYTESGAVFLSPDGQRYLVSRLVPDDGIYEVDVYEIGTGKALAHTEHRATRGGYADPSWAPDSQRFILGYPDGKAVVYDAITGAAYFTLTIPVINNPNNWFFPAWSPDGKRIATATRLNGGSHRIWDADTGAELILLDTYAYDFLFGWFPAGDRLWTYDTTRGLLVRDVSNRQKLLRVPVINTGGGVKICLSPDGGRFAVFAKPGEGVILDAATGEQLLLLKGDYQGRPECSWAPSGRRLAAASEDNTLRVWDTYSGEQVLYYPWINGGEWAPQGDWLLVSSPASETPFILPVWNTTQELIDYARACCVVRELTAEDRELFGLPPKP